jgi:hypothetical protein
LRRVVILALVVSACASSGGRSLPTAAAPSEPGGRWAVSFTRAMDPWSEGPHGYRLHLTCPDGTDINPAAHGFSVSPSESLIDGPVYLRLDGPGTGFLAPSNLRNLHPDQATVAVITLTSMTESLAAESARECQADFVFDGGDPVRLEPSDPLVP